MESQKKPTSLLKYAGLTGQFFASIAFTLFLGFKLDKWLQFKNPIFIWVLPLIIIIGLIIILIKETSNTKNDSVKK